MIETTLYDQGETGVRWMSFISDLTVPFIICFILLHGLIKGVPVFDTFVDGAKEGIGVSLRILPALVGLMTAIAMFSASGALDVLTHTLEPVTKLLCLPKEVLPLAILRPISGSGSMAIFQKLLTDLGPDSLGGRVASVMMGSAETTFYTIAVYYGATAVKDTRHTVVAGLTADVVGFVVSALVVRLFFYS